MPRSNNLPPTHQPLQRTHSAHQHGSFASRPTRMQSYLYKQSKNILVWEALSYQRRFFVLSDIEIRYFESEAKFRAGCESKGVILLLEAWMKIDPKAKTEVYINTPSRTFKLKAESEPLLHKWIQALIGAGMATQPPPRRPSTQGSVSPRVAAQHRSDAHPTAQPGRSSNPVGVPPRAQQHQQHQQHPAPVQPGPSNSVGMAQIVTPQHPTMAQPGPSIPVGVPVQPRRSSNPRPPPINPDAHPLVHPQSTPAGLAPPPPPPPAYGSGSTCESAPTCASAPPPPSSYAWISGAPTICASSVSPAPIPYDAPCVYANVPRAGQQASACPLASYANDMRLRCASAIAGASSVCVSSTPPPLRYEAAASVAPPRSNQMCDGAAAPWPAPSEAECTSAPVIQASDLQTIHARACDYSHATAPDMSASTAAKHLDDLPARGSCNGSPNEPAVSLLQWSPTKCSMPKNPHYSTQTLHHEAAAQPDNIPAVQAAAHVTATPTNNIAAVQAPAAQTATCIPTSKPVAPPPPQPPNIQCSSPPQRGCGNNMVQNPEPTPWPSLVRGNIAQLKERKNSPAHSKEKREAESKTSSAKQKPRSPKPRRSLETAQLAANGADVRILVSFGRRDDLLPMWA